MEGFSRYEADNVTMRSRRRDEYIGPKDKPSLSLPCIIELDTQGHLTIVDNTISSAQIVYPYISSIRCGTVSQHIMSELQSDLGH